MNIDVITETLQLNIYGVDGVASNRDYAATAFRLSGKMWEIVKRNGIKNKGKNIWVYEDDHKVFAGVELERDGIGDMDGLKEKNLVLSKYGYYKHIGPYHLIKQKGQEMINDLNKQGFEVVLPYVEIYGHWTGDENTSETELLMFVR